MGQISYAKALYMLQKASLEELRYEAHNRRMEIHKNHFVTYVNDANPNYSNLCDIRCSFCSFCRRKSDVDAYWKDPKEIPDLVRPLVEAGAKSILLQGGISAGVTVQFLKDVLVEFLREFPHIHPHFYSAAEIMYAADNSKKSFKEALQILYDAGLRTIPGAGAEILSPVVHKKLCPKKPSPHQWLIFHKTAHEIGFKTTATMMFGHIERDMDILMHLFSLQDLQEKTGGFLSFIPWSFKPKNLFLNGLDRYLRIIAISRCVLEAFPHISASWFGEGKELGVRALSYGADDFGGTLLTESVHKAAGYDNRSSEEEVRDLIEKAGFTPRERNNFYTIL